MKNPFARWFRPTIAPAVPSTRSAPPSRPPDRAEASGSYYILARPYDGLARAITAVDAEPAKPWRPKRFVNHQQAFRCIAIRHDADGAARLLISLANMSPKIEAQMVGDAAIAPFERERYLQEAQVGLAFVRNSMVNWH